MKTHDLLLIVLAFLSEVLGTVSGFGSSTFFVPIATFLESFQLVLVLTSILHCFGNISKITLFREGFHLNLLFKLALPSILMTTLGALLTQWIDPQKFQMVLAVTLMLSALAHGLRYTSIKMSESSSSWVIGLSGFLTGFAGTGGALRGIALNYLHLEKTTFVFMSAAIDLGGDLLRTGIYIYNGFMDLTQWHYIPLLFLAAVAGAAMGRKILQKISQKSFERLVSFFVFASGLLLFLKSLS